VKRIAIGCPVCGARSLRSGTIEGVAFLPIGEKSKTLARGAYGIETHLCRSCGQSDRWYLTSEALGVLTNLL
jgi:hypothetical protein